MADVPSWQLTIQPSDQFLHPDRVATNLYQCSLKILTELVEGGEEELGATKLECLFDQEQRLRLWGNNFDAREGGLDECLVGADEMKEDLLPLLLRLADTLVELLRLLDLGQGLQDVCSRIEDLRMQVFDVIDAPVIGDSTENMCGDTSSSGSTDGSSSSGSDISSDGEAFKLEQLIEDLEMHIVLLYRLGPVLYDPADKAPGALDYPRGAIYDQPNGSLLSNTAGPRILKIVDTYRSIDRNFARRLGEANEIRYNRLREARDKAKLQSYESDTECSDENSSEVIEQQFSSPSQAPTRQTPTEFTAPSTELSSIFDKPQTRTPTSIKIAPKPAASVTSFAPSLVSESTPSQKRGIPQIPNNNGLLEVFDCTICGSRLSNVSNSAAWVYVQGIEKLLI